MTYINYLITIWLSLITTSLTAQERTDSTNLHVLQFRETKTRNLIDYKVTIVPNENNSNDNIINRTSNRINLAKGQYLVIVETIPILKYKITIDTGIVYEIQIPKPGTVNFTSSKSGTLDIYMLGFSNKILSEITIEQNTQKEIELLAGQYQVVRKTNDQKDKKKYFKVKSNEKVAIKF